MPITNFPGGVASFGVPVLPANLLQYWNGGPVYWVSNRSGGPASSDGSDSTRPLSSVFTATTGALAKVNGTYGALIVILPGHTENIAASTNLSTLMGSGATNCNVVSLGNGSQRATFSHTAAASALLANLAGTWFRNCVFNLAATAATVVTAAITTSAVDCGFEACDFLPNTSATQLTTTAITVASGSTNLQFINCRAFGETFATNPTDFLTTTAAVDRLTIVNSKFLVAMNTTTNGAINLANAPTNVYIENSTFINKKAASTVAAIASASTTGAVTLSTFIVQAAGAPSTAFNTPGNLHLSQCFGGQITKAGAIQGTVAT
jgi:hypothetical protein